MRFTDRHPIGGLLEEAHWVSSCAIGQQAAEIDDMSFLSDEAGSVVAGRPVPWERTGASAVELTAAGPGQWRTARCRRCTRTPCVEATCRRPMNPAGTVP